MDSNAVIELCDSDVARIVNDLATGERSYHLMGDGRRLVFGMVSDEFAYVSDCEDWLGKVSECSDGGRHRHRPRPDGFDGSAYKVRDDRGSVYWWQPPVDAIGNPELINSLRRSLVNILSFGFLVGFVDLEEKCSHGDWHTVANASLGMLEPIPNEPDLAMIVQELLYQLDDSREMAA